MYIHGISEKETCVNEKLKHISFLEGCNFIYSTSLLCYLTDAIKYLNEFRLSNCPVISACLLGYIPTSVQCLPCYLAYVL